MLGNSRLAWSALFLGLGLLGAGVGCDGSQEADRTSRSEKPNPEPPAPALVEGKRAQMAKNVYLEVMPDGSRRVLVMARVCLRQGQLEQLLTRANKKEHEAVLAADADAREIHKALLLTKATPGSPVKFDPAYQAARGTKIRISLIYEKNGKKVKVPARSWVRNVHTKKELETDWVFAGSVLATSPLDPKAPPQYMANEGDVICVANFDTALLDVPFESSKANDKGGYEAWTERIPAEQTPVTVVLEPELVGGAAK